MRILTLSAYYPPYTYGGYEIRVGDIMDGLSQRGHEIRILTTKPDFALRAIPKDFPYPVIRRLHSPARKLRFFDWLTTRKLTRWLGISLVFLREILHDIQDTALLDTQIRAFKPDLLYLGHIMPLTRAFMPFLSKMQIPIVADEGGKGLIYSWQDHGLWQRFQAEFPEIPHFLGWLKKLTVEVVDRVSKGRVSKDWAFPKGIRAIFNSDLNRRNAEAAGVPLAETTVIHSGIDTQFFTFKRSKEFGSPLTILVPGRIEENKRQLDAVRLGALLKERGIPFELVIVGGSWNSTYAEWVEAEIQTNGLQKEVRILPMAGRADLVELYHWADITFFPSIQNAGLSRIPLEATACGSLLISYGCEGSDEIIRNGVNGFITIAGNIDKLGEIITNLFTNQQLYSNITSSARTKIENELSLSGYIQKIEDFILNTESLKSILKQNCKEEKYYQL